MSIFQLTGTALQNALLRLGRYCFDKECEVGKPVDVAHIMGRINDSFNLVKPDQFSALVHDVENAYAFLREQQLSHLSRPGYAAFRAANAFGLEEQLGQDLRAMLGGGQS